ncbi:hypothetical protein [Bacillus alkalisoli]|nr:hypothetical protein [Bacillus alkalisoli]
MRDSKKEVPGMQTRSFIKRIPGSDHAVFQVQLDLPLSTENRKKV